MIPKLIDDSKVACGIDPCHPDQVYIEIKMPGHKAMRTYREARSSRKYAQKLIAFSRTAEAAEAAEETE